MFSRNISAIKGVHRTIENVVSRDALKDGRILCCFSQRRQHAGRHRQVHCTPVNEAAFVKNLFMGRLIKEDVFPYPEISVEKFQEINELCAPIEKFFREDVPSKEIDLAAKIDDKTMQALKEMGLFGQQIPEEYGGLALSNVEYAKIQEYTSYDGAIAVTLAAHQAIGLKGILMAGTDEQKRKYLPKLATGEHVAAFCLTEPSSGSDAGSLRTRATLSPDGKHYLLNGSKIWISNGGIADVFTVFAREDVVDDKGEKKDKISAFIVERKFGGITSGKPEDKLGIRGSNTCEVHFENCPVPVENMIGEPGSGFKLALNILNNGRFSMGASGGGIIRTLIGEVVEHAVTRKQFDTKLKEFGMIKEKIGRMAISAYVMESTAFLTASMMDRPGEKDCSLEAAIVKIYSSEACWEHVSQALQILGGLGYMKDYPYERYLRDSRIMMIFEGTNEILRLFIALTGLQYAGNELKDALKKLKNPMSNPRFIFSSFIDRVKYRMGMKKDMKIFPGEGGIHPTFKEQTKKLEECVGTFYYVNESMLSKYKKDIINQQLVLKRIADISIDIYSMTAVLSRATRAKVNGIKNNDHDCLIATVFCNEAYDRVMENVRQLALSPDANGDSTIERISDEICENRAYVASHPLTKEF
ncbi:complex I assembly factor ACAD9, mitochondrial-like [Anneissia japonica]|uniref:complex I assembly factor ACAD9, mitochondrial-like n=1 Tax=Anneissia japonica TaxID=1529436 RepID=UPI00142562F7|nr:complex I assembly factor ACAD9, mitochondrial-like [Anneissia japonica]